MGTHGYACVGVQPSCVCYHLNLGVVRGLSLGPRSSVCGALLYCCICRVLSDVDLVVLSSYVSSELRVI